MIPDSWVHLSIMGAFLAFSLLRKANIQFIFVLCVYCASWQMSDYLSYQYDVSLFFKVYFQNAVSIALIFFITNLKYTRFTALFVGLLFINIISLFCIVLLDKYASVEVFNGSIGIFTIINIQLIYLELLAIAGITFDMDNDKGTYRKSIDGVLCDPTTAFSAMGSTSQSDEVAKKQKQEGSLINA